MALPEGFRATLFAGEPEIVKPIAFTFDDRGRLWVAECLTYPEWNPNAGPDTKGHDRIVILEDTDGDGQFDKKTVFTDQLENLTGLEIGFGGIYVCSTPNLLFIPVNDGEDRPAGPAKVVLDGWNVKDAHHNVFNGLTWGPDGWLYGLNGIQSNSNVGLPGATDDQRTKMNCGVWRYHPTKHIFEVVAHGTTNPWGLDFDDFGQAFTTNCVIKHLWHIIPGAHYQRMFGQDYNPNVFGLMESCADHIHWAGGDWTDSRGGLGLHGVAGGGHAHAGCMVYLGDNWPDAYRGSVFMCNIHGKRVNNDILEQKGSGYVAHHGKDFLFATDPWFLGLAIKCGPDGGVFVSDWSNSGECHDITNIDRTHGRIYKVTYGSPPLVHPDLAKLSDDELVTLQLHKNDWFVRHARRLLQERAAAHQLSPTVPQALWKIIQQDSDQRHQLRALWALHVTTGISLEQTLGLLDNPTPFVRGWAIQLALEDRLAPSMLLAKLTELAKSDPSPIVRLYLAAALQRLPISSRGDLVEALVTHAEDAQDLNLPLMTWYGLEPTVVDDPRRALGLLATSNIPLIRENIAHRLAVIPPDGLNSLVRTLGLTDEEHIQLDVLRGITEAYQEERNIETPLGWQDVARKLAGSTNGEVREKARLLSLLFGDIQALPATEDVVLDESANPEERQRAIQALVRHRDPELPSVLRRVLANHTIAAQALRALAACPGDETSQIILSHYQEFDAAERVDALNTLASRPAWGIALVKAIDQGIVPRADISTMVIRQLTLLGDSQLNEKLSNVWGTIQSLGENKKSLIVKFKTTYTPEVIEQANLSNGRSVFNRTCAQCHTLFDSGGKVGPNLTGSQRANLDFLFEKVLAPNAIVAKEYLMTIVETTDGRVVSGIIQKETPAALTLRTTSEEIVVLKNDIEARKNSNISLMPEGILESLTATDCRDLLGYLGSNAQVPLLGNAAPISIAPDKSK